MDTEAINKLTTRWAEPDGLPIKNRLVNDDGCMCAQGQALHFLGGYSLEDLRQMGVLDADKNTARVLGISTSHSILLRHVNDKVDGTPSIVLTEPAQLLGDQSETVLAFWRHLGVCRT